MKEALQNMSLEEILENLGKSKEITISNSLEDGKLTWIITDFKTGEGFTEYEGNTLREALMKMP